MSDGQAIDEAAIYELFNFPMWRAREWPNNRTIWSFSPDGLSDTSNLIDGARVRMIGLKYGDGSSTGSYLAPTALILVARPDDAPRPSRRYADGTIRLDRVP